MKFFKKLFILMLIAIAVLVSMKVSEGYDMFRKALKETPLVNKVAEIKSKDNYTTKDELPEMYIKAVIAAEDHRFYTHSGVDIISICSAIWNDLTSLSLVQGGSTITQQLAKNTYFTQEKKLTRKIAEIFMALEIEKNYDKDEVLELYLNTSYFGEGCYTVKEASRKYFNKEPIEMNDYESVMLAGIPNAPSVYAPTVNPDLAKERQMQVLKKMIRYNVITESESQKILELGE